MTRQEILNTPEIVDFMIDKSVMVDSKMKLHKRLEELCKLAIKALEQQPCEDCISRADVKKYLSAPDANGDRVIYESDLDLLPSVTPKAEQKAVLGKIRAEIEQLTSRYSISKRSGMGIVEWSDRLIEESDVLQIIDKYKEESEDKK